MNPIVNLFDTVKLLNRRALVVPPQDEKMLEGFKRTTRQVTEESETGESETVLSDFWSQEETGIRVQSSGRGVSIEASIPRVLGLPNVEGGTLSEGDVETAFTRLRDLLPGVSAAGDWELTRVDLACNVACTVPAVVNAHASVRCPYSRQAPKVYFDQSVCWYGTTRQVIIYDKGIESGLELLAGRLGRVESRWMKSRGMLDLANKLAEVRALLGSRPSSFGVRLAVPQKVRNRQNLDTWLPVGDRRLMAALFEHDLAWLPRREPMPLVRTTRHFALAMAQRHPEDTALLLSTMPKRSKNRFLAHLKGVALDSVELDVRAIIARTLAAGGIPAADLAA